MWILPSEDYHPMAVMVCHGAGLGAGVGIAMHSAGGNRGPERAQGVGGSGVKDPWLQCNGQPWLLYSHCGPLHWPKHLHPLPLSPLPGEHQSSGAHRGCGTSRESRACIPWGAAVSAPPAPVWKEQSAASVELGEQKRVRPLVPQCPLCVAPRGDLPDQDV